MPTALDQGLDMVLARVTAADGPLPLTMVESRGAMLPMVASAPATLPDYFAQHCGLHADATFLVAGEERLTFAEVHAAARRVAAGLIARHGVAKGDRIGIAARNAPAWIAGYMGILMAGGIATLLNGWWEPDELTAAIDDVGCALVIADAARARRLAAGGHGARVIELDVAAPLAEALTPIAAAPDDAALPPIGATDPATILFTSGSTGQSKGALSDHRAVVQGVYNYLATTLTLAELAAMMAMPVSPLQPATLLNVPLFHVTAEVPVFLQSFAMGRRLVLMPRWDAEEAMRLIEAEKITYFTGVPLMSFEILNHPRRHEYDLSSCTDFAAGGAPRPVEHVRRIKEEMGGSNPVIGYGLTETNAVGCANIRDNYLAKPNSTGRATTPLVDLAILDEAGAALPPGERGEVCIRSIANIREYWGRPEATAAAFTADGYFRTGDIGYLDEDGYLFIVDRKKDIIIRGGENISCQEVEAALYEHPDVAEACVFGLPDERYGEVPGAVVHLREPGAVEAEDLIAFLSSHIAAFKVPQRVWISADPLPRLGTEKIDKVSLRRAYRERVAAEAA